MLRRWRLTAAGLCLSSAFAMIFALDGLANEPKSQALPRYMSLKSDRVELRPRPGPEHAPQWIFSRVGLPIEVIGSQDGWAQVRDAEGTAGWVRAAQLSRRRTILVKSSTDGDGVPLRADGRSDSRTLALLGVGLIASLFECNGQWCVIGVPETRGYIEQTSIWGVADREVIK